MPFHAKRIYDQPEHGDGLRVLVEPDWPSGAAREAAQVDLWLKECAPSETTRSLGREPDRWEEFKELYFRELESMPCVLDALFFHAASGDVTLLYSAPDARHNSAQALKEYLESHAHA